MQWVFDASVVMAWCFDDEKSDATEGLLKRVATTPAVVPQIWPLEVGNVLVLATRKGRIKPAQRAEFVGMLSSLPLTIDADTSLHAFEEVLSLADRYELTTYDACYLELAVRAKIPLATLDQQLRRAASKAGVPLL